MNQAPADQGHAGRVRPGVAIAAREPAHTGSGAVVGWPCSPLPALAYSPQYKRRARLRSPLRSLLVFMSSAASMYSETKSKLDSLEEMQSARSGFPPDNTYLDDRIVESASKAGSIGSPAWGAVGKGFLAGTLFTLWAIITDDGYRHTTNETVVLFILVLLIILIFYRIVRGIERWDKLEIRRRQIMLNEVRYLIATEVEHADYQKRVADNDYAEGYHHGVLDERSGNIDESIFPPNLKKG